VSGAIVRHSGGFTVGALYRVVKAGASLNFWALAPGGNSQMLARRELKPGQLVRYWGTGASGGDGVTMDLFAAVDDNVRGHFSPCFYGLALCEFLELVEGG
jgi:hypothetical protein